ncbi:hypothetical protein RV134_270091 [Roseovarius sp. EC-HK134]|nr:hypothetical protein RV134_270091 [Roseovarius sp. EC-HK134]VVT14609.1 hypothetical protein RV420_310096 [Roseovarius sp. EC-SD190]
MMWLNTTASGQKQALLLDFVRISVGSEESCLFKTAQFAAVDAFKGHAAQ